MKMTIIITLNMLFASLIFSGCEEEEIDGHVNFEFRLLTATGQPSTTFKEDENFIFSFLIINNSKEQKYLESINNMDAFFEVFDLSSNQENGERASLGQPYKAIQCEFVNGYVIPSQDTLKIEVPWIPQLKDENSYPKILCNYKFDNTYIPQGTYTTGFSSRFTISSGDHSFTTETKSFEINFEVK